MSDLERELRKYSSIEKAKGLSRFFKTGKGEYGEGDKFLGVVVPNIRKISLKFKDLNLNEIDQLLKSPWHEVRLCALLILVEKSNITDFYLDHTKYINNWDLVDLTASKLDFDEKIKIKLAKSQNLWERRIAIVSTFYNIYQGDSGPTLKIAKLLLSDKHDLIHKAVGWMLREVGKRVKEKDLTDFLDENVKIMPRTMLRYAIERLPNRLKYLNVRKTTC